MQPCRAEIIWGFNWTGTCKMALSLSGTLEGKAGKRSLGNMPRSLDSPFSLRAFHQCSWTSDMVFSGLPKAPSTWLSDLQCVQHDFFHVCWIQWVTITVWTQGRGEEFTMMWMLKDDIHWVISREISYNRHFIDPRCRILQQQSARFEIGVGTQSI